MSFMEFVIGVIALAAAIGVVGFRNPLYSAFALIVHLLALIEIISKTMILYF